MQMAVTPSTADVAYIGCFIAPPEGTADVSSVTDKTVALAVKSEEEANAGDENVHESHHPSKRKNGASGGNFNKNAPPLPLSLSGTGSRTHSAK